MGALILAIVLILSAGPALADPVTGALTTALTGVFGAKAAAAIAGFLVRTIAGAAMSRLALALKKKPEKPGIRTEATQTGGVSPYRFPLGLTAVHGQLMAPANSYGEAGHTPRGRLVYPIALSIIAGCELNRIVVNDEYITLAAPGSAGVWGRTVTGPNANYCDVDYINGSQTAAHPGMMAHFAADPDRPWMADMIGPGLCAAFTRFTYNTRLWSGLPSVLFEVRGIPLYDPRLDSTAGGSGPHRWNTRSTWTWSTNPVVMIYNIMRGIAIGGGLIWGAGYDAEDLPNAAWFAAMNACDLPIDDGDGGTNPQYQAGFEVALDDEPLAVIGELLKVCSGQMAEVGGVWDIQAGGPRVPVMHITDDDIYMTQEQEFDPFPSLLDTFNGITASYPEPESLWEAKDAPPRFNATWEADDGGRRLVADLSLPACPWGEQVQRLMQEEILDHRRFRRHRHVLPPEAAILSPLDCITWTSVRFGYTAKAFEIGAVHDSLTTMRQGIAIREVDGSDFAWVPANLLPSAPSAPGTTPPAAQGVPGWAATPHTILDGASAARRPAIRIAWTPGEITDARGLRHAIRLAGDTGDGVEGPLRDVATGFAIISEALLPNTAYQVRAQIVADRATNWSGWVSVTTPNVGLRLDDLAQTVLDHMTSTAIAAGIEPVAVLPATGTLNKLVFLTSTGVVYRWTGSAWTQTLYTPPVAGSVTVAAFAAGIRPYEVVTSLPAGPHTQGRMVLLTTDMKLYRNTGSGWTKAVDGEDLTLNSIGVGVLKAGVVSAAEMAIGFGGNWAANPDFMAGSLGWRLSTSGAAGAATVLNMRGPGQTFSGSQFQVVELFQNDAANTGTADFLSNPLFDNTGSVSFGHPVKAGDRLQVHALLSTHRCGGFVALQWLDAAGAFLGNTTVATVPLNVTSDQDNPDKWPQYGGFAAVPADGTFANPVAYVRLLVRKSATASGANSYLMIHKPFIGLATPNQTEFSPWDAGRVTKIGNGQLLTDSVNTRTLLAGSVVTESLAASAVVASKVAAGTLTSNLFNTTSMGVAGLAVFGGTLRSTNFVSGVSGWQITNAGNAEFNSLIDRSALLPGSVSDGPETFFAGPYSNPALIPAGGNYDYVSNHVLGRGVTAGDFWLLSVTMECRGAVELYLQTRSYRGGAWGAWENVTGSRARNYAIWATLSIYGIFSDIADNIEFRQVIRLNAGGGSSIAAGTQFVRNITINFKAPKR